VSFQPWSDGVFKEPPARVCVSPAADRDVRERRVRLLLLQFEASHHAIAHFGQVAVIVPGPIGTGFSNCQSPREQQFAIQRVYWSALARARRAGSKEGARRRVSRNSGMALSRLPSERYAVARLKRACQLLGSYRTAF